MGTRAGARRGQDRLQTVAGAVTGLGAAVYLYSVYHVLQAGGLTVSSELGACGEAATGRWTTSYRLGEQLVVEHGYLPPSATCHWSGGSEAVLVAPTWTWAGLVLVGLGALVLVVLLVLRRR